MNEKQCKRLRRWFKENRQLFEGMNYKQLKREYKANRLSITLEDYSKKRSPVQLQRI